MTERELAELIADAFADVPYPGDDKVKGGDWDLSSEIDTGGYIGRGFRGKHWREIPAEVLRLNAWHGSLTFMTPEVLHYYLPAFLLGSLSDGEVQEHVINWLPVPSPDAWLPDLLEAPLSLLSRPQRQAIALLLSHLATRGDLADSDITGVVAYWASYLPAS